jgi:hypothetical protein
MRFLRRRRNIGKTASPTWQDNRPEWGNGDPALRYMHIPEIDRWRAVPFAMPPDPDRGAVLQRVRQITESLDGAIDEGTGGALDPIIESWVATWIATVQTDYTDHCAVINVHRAQAAQWLVESTHTAQHENEELQRIRSAYLASRARLSGEQPVHPSTPHTDTNGDLA